MDSDDRLEVLRRALAQDRHSDAAIRALADQACELEYQAGATLVREGQPTTESWLILRGRIEISRRAGRRSIAEAGDLIDPSGGASTTVSAISAQALEPTAVLAIPTTKPDDR